VDPNAVARSVADLRADDLGKGELRAALNAVVEASAAVFGADGAGVMLIDDEQALHYVGATDGRAAALEAAQEETGEGPCIDSLVNDTLVCTSDLIDDDRWPRLRQQIGSLGVRAILGAPLRLGMGAIGSLNVYRFEPWTWDEADIAGVQAYAQVVEELLGAAILARQRHTIVDQLSRALQHRVVIERAVGVLMATEGMDAVRAFDGLRRAARSRRVRVSDLAEQILSARRFSTETEGSGPRWTL
jgi:transcriptional regulator with GAF, ATPase, and Fis domain